MQLTHTPLPMVLPTAVARSGRDDSMHSVPQHVEGGHGEVQCGRNRGKVVQVLDGMHGKARKRFRVDVAMVQ